MIEYPVSRHDWLHGQALCPACRLPLDPQRDLEEYAQALDATRPHAVLVKHGRCGAQARLVFSDATETD